MKTQPITAAEIDFGDGGRGRDGRSGAAGAAGAGHVDGTGGSDSADGLDSAGRAGGADGADVPPPRSRLYGDLYHPRVGALAQARHVFLGGNGLPGRWAGRDLFVVLETGFGLGHNFIATWDAWRGDAARCARLVFVSIERHPPSRGDLARAHAQAPLPGRSALAQALLQAWPPATPGLHMLDFEHGRVRLLLALGDVAALLPVLRLQADAVFLDGFAPTHNPQMWTTQVIKGVARLAAPGATLATWSVAGALHAALRTAGFQVHTAPGTGSKRLITQAHYAPRYSPRRLPSPAVLRAPRADDETGFDAVVVGAGLAGAAAALALAQQGLRVQVLERAAQPAHGASGNAAALFHGSVNRDDGVHTRLLRAAAFAAAPLYSSAIASGCVAGQIDGLLQAAPADTALADLRALATAQALPADYVQAVGAAAASAAAGVPIAGPGWLYAAGGWLAPAQWVAWALAHPGIQLQTGCAVDSLQRDGSAWLLGSGGHAVARAGVVVLATGGDVQTLLHPTPIAGAQPWPLRAVRGQVSVYTGPTAEPIAEPIAAPIAEPIAVPITLPITVPSSTPNIAPLSLRLPVTGDGYVIPLPGALLFGATRQADDADVRLRAADHVHNLQRLQRLTRIDLSAQAAALQGRVGWRQETDDRLPIAGALPLWPMPAGTRCDQARLLPRQQGLFVVSALGSRGLTLAPLLGRLVAAMATGAPWPLEQDLCDAIDPGRWIVRAARRSTGAQAV